MSYEAWKERVAAYGPSQERERVTGDVDTEHDRRMLYPDKAPLPPGSYTDLTLEPPDGPQCCDEVRRVTCWCKSAWECPQHGSWHFGSEE